MPVEHFKSKEAYRKNMAYRHIHNIPFTAKEVVVGGKEHAVKHSGGERAKIDAAQRHKSVGHYVEKDGKKHAKLPHHSEAAATPHRPAHVHHADYYDGHKDGFGRQDRNRVMYRDSVPDGKRAE